MSLPPPPPPPPPPPVASVPAPPRSAANALFEEIRSAGDSIASRLRHVPEYKKVYKWKVKHGTLDMSALELRKKQAEMRKLKESEESAGQGHTGAAKNQTKGPVLLLENGKRWLVSSHVGSPEQQLRVCLDGVQMQHTVCVQDCRYVSLEVKGKVNSVSIVHCHKAQVALSSVVSSVEILGCTDIDVQVAEAAPSVVVENSSTVNIYLLSPEHSRETDIFSTRITTVNVLFPSRDDPEDMVELPLPEQFVSKIVLDGKKGDVIKTTPNRH
ncbi:unnamed protein product [Phytomonas sp. EM1]|nr:unnamed protein product [Phytomonas sp. EM1]|eukprot:CCW63319.1 unnamed protein product [Phytomonas sp. isolate EM1]